MQEIKQEAQADLNQLLGFVFLLVVTGAGIAYGLDVIVDVRDDFTAGTDEYMAVQNSILAINKVPEKLPTVATIFMAAVIIGVLVTLLVRFAR